MIDIEDNFIENFATLLVLDEDVVQRYHCRFSSGKFSLKRYGAQYLRSVETVPYCKNIGIRSLLQLAHSGIPGPILDVLGGSGQVALAAKRYGLFASPERILTADIEIDQVNKARQAGLPAIPLDVTDLRVIREKVFSSIIIAYGFHHIAPERRSLGISEAFRVLAPGGTLVLHEGLHGGRMARISDELVDVLADEPHPYSHPTLKEVRSLFAGLTHYPIQELMIFDPQVFLSSNTDRALISLRNYFVKHYALPEDTPEKTIEEYLSKICEAHYPFECTNGEFWGKRRLGLTNEAYLRRLYVGETPQEVLRAMFPRRLSFLPSERFCAIVPRYAHVTLLRRDTIDKRGKHTSG